MFQKISNLEGLSVSGSYGTTKDLKQILDKGNPESTAILETVVDFDRIDEKIGTTKVKL